MTDAPKIKERFINKETGAQIAMLPEELPPLREGYVRLVHQTHMVHADSIVENGLIYSRKNANKSDFPNYSDLGSLGVAYDEDAFWNQLTQEGIRHRGADVIAIFDMPLEECGAHLKWFLAQYLNGTVSRGYLVGIIPNYGTKDINGDVKKLSMFEMQTKKKLSKSNPLPPLYETPNWRESIQKAWNIFLKQQNDINDNL